MFLQYPLKYLPLAELQKRISGDILLKVKHALKADPLAMTPNNWEQMNHDRKYSYSNSSPNSLVGKCVLYYCNASIYARNTTIQQSFIYFAGVCSFVAGQYFRNLWIVKVFYDVKAGGGW